MLFIRKELPLFMVKRALLLVLIFGIFASLSAWAQTTRTAVSCAVSDVQAQVNAAANGDTVQIPACPQTNWSTTLSVTKCITIKGAGQGSTTLGDNVAKSGSPSQLISFSPNCSTGSIVLSDMTIVGVAADPNVNNQGHIFIGGGANSLKNFHIHHITVNSPQTSLIRDTNPAAGLVDHLTENNCGTAGGASSVGAGEINVEWDNYGNSSYGDGSWAEADSNLPGSSNAVYIEDNTFNCGSGSVTNNMVDGFAGARWVFRFNAVNNANTTAHGVDTGGRKRAVRWQESYKNTFTYPSGTAQDFIMWFRGGSGVVWGNTVNSDWINSMAKVDYQRSSASYAPWGQCNGTSVFDINSDASGYRCVDQPGAGQSANLLASISGPNGGPATFPVNNASLPAYVYSNSWTGHTADNSNPVGGGDARTVQNRDFYRYTSTFNGSSGVGAGTLASRPSTCTTGVAYWATDQGSWNKSASGGQGVLYKCTSTNTWSLYYTPYTYPHPLQTGGSSGGGGVNAPSALQAVAH